MPHFMDVHRTFQGFSLEDIEAAHLRDVEAQEQFGVSYTRFFHNADTGHVYCLAEGPDAEACVAVHRAANGLEPDQIIPVDPSLVDSFLGQELTRPSGAALTWDGKPDVGARTILFTDIVDSTRLTAELGDDRGVALVEAHDDIVERALAGANGRRVKHTGDGLMASFEEPAAAVSAAVATQRELAAYRQGDGALPLRVRIGIHTGEPVAARGDLFGLAVNTARRICDAGAEEGILISDIVRPAAAGLGHDTVDLGDQTFKGISDPVRVHRVMWLAPDSSSPAASSTQRRPERR